MTESLVNLQKTLLRQAKRIFEAEGISWKHHPTATMPERLAFVAGTVHQVLSARPNHSSLLVAAVESVLAVHDYACADSPEEKAIATVRLGRAETNLNLAQMQAFELADKASETRQKNSLGGIRARAKKKQVPEDALAYALEVVAKGPISPANLSMQIESWLEQKGERRSSDRIDRWLTNWRRQGKLPAHSTK